MDLQAELAMRLGAKRPAKCPKVDEEAWPSDEASEPEGEGRTAGRGEKKKEKKTKKKKSYQGFPEEHRYVEGSKSQSQCEWYCASVLV